MKEEKTKTIVQSGDAILRKTAEAVTLSDITAPPIQKIIADMKLALSKEHDGAALAAPQIAVSLRIFIVSGKILSKNPDEQVGDLVCINPVIIRTSKKKKPMDEGCLSVRGKYGLVSRATRVTIEAYNEKGEKFVRGAGGLLAQAFQHEIDHLNGILFTDKAEHLELHTHD